MRALVLLLVGGAALADVSLQPQQSINDAPERWAAACRRELMTAREAWMRQHPELPAMREPSMFLQRADKGRRNFPRIGLFLNFFDGKGSVQVNWREPWTAPLPDTLWPPKESPNWGFGGIHRGLVRSTVGQLPRDDWYPPGSRAGSVGVFGAQGGLEHPFFDAFWPAVERCVRL